MYLYVNNTETKVQADDEELAWLTEFLQFEDGSESFYMMNGQAGYSGTTQRRFYNYKTRTFPAGLTAMVYRRGQAAGYKISVVDQRNKPAELDPSISLAWLQRRTLCDGTTFQYAAVLRAMTRSRGLLWLPTGSGKTEIAVGIMKAVPAIRWLFLVPEGDLMYNAARRWESRTGEDAGLVGDGKWPTGTPRVVCATFQTLARRLKDPKKRESTIALLATFKGVIVDECHQLPADDFFGVMLSLHNAYYRIGMSGTALARGDKRNMYILAALGEVIYRVEPRALMEAGWISRPTVRFVPVTQGQPTQKTYIGAYKAQIVRSQDRNRVLVRLAERAQKPCLLFIKYEEHGRLLLKELQKRGNVSVEFMSGKHKMSQRDAILDRVRWGDTDVIIATKVLQTGTDIPELASLVIGTGGASNIESVQRVGRGMRVIKAEDGSTVKNSVDVWEIYDKDAKELNPKTRRKRATRMKWFEKHSKARMHAYQSEGYPTIELKPVDAAKFGGKG